MAKTEPFAMTYQEFKDEVEAISQKWSRGLITKPEQQEELSMLTLQYALGQDPTQHRVPERYPSNEALKMLNESLRELDETSPNKAVRLSNARLRDDAALALSQAVGCRLAPTARAMAFLGLTWGENQTIGVRYIEQMENRDEHTKAALRLVSLTEELVEQALKANCGCSVSDQPAPFLE